MAIHKQQTLMPIMLLLLIFVVWTGIRGLTFDAIWYDEWRSFLYIGVNADTNPTLINTLSRVINESDALNPPAYYLLLYTWTEFTGTHPVAARYLSVLLGVLTVAWVYRIGTDIESPVAGIFAAAIMGSSTLFAIYMHEIRTYVLAALLVVIHLWVYWRCLRPKSGRADIFLLAAITTAMLYTHYTAGIMAAGTFAYHLIFVRKRWSVLGAYVAAGILFLPWIGIALSAAPISELDTRQKYGKSALEIITTLAQHFSNGFWYLAIVPLLLALRGKWLLWVFFITGLLMLGALNEFSGFLSNSRYLLVLLPPLALLAGWGLSWRPQIGIIFAVLWLASGFWLGYDLTYAHKVVNSERWHLQWDEAAANIQPYVQTGDVVVTLLPGGIRNWTHNDVAAYYFPETEFALIHQFSATKADETIDWVEEVIAGKDQIWLVQFPSQYRAYNHEAVEVYLIKNFGTPISVNRTEQVDVQLYDLER